MGEALGCFHQATQFNRIIFVPDEPKYHHASNRDQGKEMLVEIFTWLLDACMHSVFLKKTCFVKKKKKKKTCFFFKHYACMATW